MGCVFSHTRTSWCSSLPESPLHRVQCPAPCLPSTFGVAMDNTSQILLRSAELLAGQRLLLVNPAADELTRELPADWHVWSWDYSAFRGLRGRLPEHQLRFSPLCPAVEGLEGAILVMPKAIERAEYALAQMAPLLAAGCPLYLVGEKKGGITRAE